MNDAELHERASRLFLELRALPRSEREAALDAASAGEAELRAEVVELLAHDVAEPPASENGDLPRQIGPYRVLARLGRGGSGHVFLGEQLEPIRRRVAIKVVPQAAVDPELAARFEVERRALERTDHPNIARVLDAGRTGEGSPYLVIDYVEGVTLVRSCDERGLDLRARIELTTQIADAVEHAHQRGVVHRDLKPANILVAEVDGRPTPRVLDFGIAKPVGGAFADESPRTSGLPVGTPAYMAPEQTGIGAVDARADVYALGAVLYELAAGRPPLDVRGDPLAALQRVRDEVPQAVSRARASSRHSGDAVSSALLADLDTVLAKALEKQPERRYASAGAFAADLRRLLRCEPVEARAPTLAYRATRFARRNRVAVSAAVIVLVAAAIGLSSWLEARRQRATALDEGEAQRELNSFFSDDVLAALSPDDLGGGAANREVLDRAAERLEQRFAGRPTIAAAVHHTLGVNYTELGAYTEAERHLARAVELRAASLGADAPETIVSELAAASLRVRQRPDAEAERVLRALIVRARNNFGVDHAALYSGLNDLGVVLMEQTKAREALEVLEEALAGRRRLLGDAHRDVVTTIGNIAHAHGQLGDAQASLKAMLEALALVETLPNEPRVTLLSLNNNIGATYQDIGENEKAAPYLRRAAEIAHETLGADHEATLTIEGNLAGIEADVGDPARAAELYRSVSARLAASAGPDAEETLSARYGCANALWKAKRYDEAIAEFGALLEDSIDALSETHWQTVQTRVSLAVALLEAGRAREALPHAELGETQFDELFGADHPRSRGAAAIAQRARDALADPEQ